MSDVLIQSSPAAGVTRVAAIYGRATPRCSPAVWAEACERYPEQVARLRAAEKATDAAWVALLEDAGDGRLVTAFEVSLVDLERALADLSVPVALARIALEEDCHE